MIGLIIIVILAIPFIIWAIKLSNKEIKIRNAVKAQQKVCNAYFDKAWKVIKQGADTSDEYRKLFEKIYPDLVTGRYKGDKTMLMKWVKEENPKILTELYEKLMKLIDNQRYGFFREQEELIKFDLQHKNLRMTFPNNIIVGRRSDVSITVIEADINLDNDIKLFS
jgi:hypothetical protein